MGANEGMAIVLGLLIIGAVYFLWSRARSSGGISGSNRDDGINRRDR